MFYTEEQCEEAMTPLATPMDAMREYAHVVGQEQRDRAWLITDYDVYVRNPWYAGPPVDMPEL